MIQCVEHIMCVQTGVCCNKQSVVVTVWKAEQRHVLTFELESGLKFTQRVAKLWFRDHNKTKPKLVLSSSKYHNVYPNYAQVFQVAYSLNTFAASYLNTQGLNNSCLKSRQLRP